MKIWLDNKIEAPDGYVQCFSENMAIAWLMSRENNADNVENSAPNHFSEYLNTPLVSIGTDIACDRILEYIKDCGRECKVEHHHFV